MSFGRLEAVIATPLSEDAWREHWRDVVGLRRRYAGPLLIAGLVAGSGAAAGALLVDRGEWLSVLPFSRLPDQLAAVHRSFGFIDPTTVDEPRRAVAWAW